MSSRLLVVEDEEILRITIMDHLLHQGWDVDEAENGLDALELVKKKSYDLIVSDIRMPGLDGEKLLAKVKQLTPGTEVILMTAHGNSENAVACLKQAPPITLSNPLTLTT